MHHTEIQQSLHDAGVPSRARILLWDAAYRPVSAGWMLANWQAWVQALPAELQVWRMVGGRSVLCPLWVREGWDCDNHALACMAHGSVGNALTIVRGGHPAGLAKGFVTYTAAAREENGHRNGRHAICWYVNHLRNTHFFEPGDGRQTILTQQELRSIDFACAA